jgi:hypothetical protein
MDIFDAIASLDRANLGAPFDNTPLIDFDGMTLSDENFVTIDALSLSGTNTFALSAATEPVADVIALVATLGNDGIVHIPGVDGVGFFTMASINVGATKDLSVTASLSDGTLPVTLSICETDPLTAICVNPETPTQDPVSLNMATNGTPTFSIFLSATGQQITLYPAYKRVMVQFSDDQGVLRGATSVALETIED